MQNVSSENFDKNLYFKMDKPDRCERRYPHKYSPIECSYQSCIYWVNSKKMFRLR